MSDTKQCTKCGEVKGLNEFCKDRHARDGKTFQCRQCAAEYRKANKEAIHAYRKAYYQVNKEAVDAAHRAYYRANKSKVIKRTTEYGRRRYHSDPAYRIARLCRDRVRVALAGKVKSAATMELIGCDIEHLKFHIEQQFTDGMTWDNQGEWHLDHIQPCASFDLTDPEQQKACFHYTNLQPLWAEMNLKKSDHAPDEHQIKLI